MKNLTVKKIALGLFLAGYGASSAFAATLTPATTVKTIVGNAPIMQATKANPADHTMTLRIYQGTTNTLVGENNKVSVGDTIKITFNLKDLDGDKDAEKIKDTFKVYIKTEKSDTVPWTAVDVSSIVQAETNGESGTISFAIPDSFSGAEVVGYQLLERTAYGAPFANSWLQVTDIWNMTDNPNVTAANQTDPIGTGPADAGGGNHGSGDGDKDNGTGPIINGTKTKIGIFKSTAGSIDTAHNYAATGATQIPQYGETFIAAVFDDDDGDGQLDAGKTLKRTGYTYTWKLAGSYDPVALNGATGETAVTAVDEEIPGVSGTGKDTVLLGTDDTTTKKHNTGYNAAYKAGAQGYQLKVEGK